MSLKKLREMKKNKKGFTLIEIIVVVVILAVLMAIAVPAVLKYLDEADNAKYESTARGAYIATEAELTKAYTDTDAATNAASAYTAAMAEINKGVNSSAANYVTSIVAEGVETNGDPRAVSKYVITFQGGKTATLVPNGSVTITDTSNGK